MTHGHADAAAIHLVEQLESSLSEKFDAGAAADLALLCLEPLHDEERARELAGQVAAADPTNALAVLVNAYLALHYLMTEVDLEHSATQLRRLLARGSSVGAAAMMLDEVLRELNPGSPYDANIELLVRSVQAEPGWTLNRRRYATALVWRGKHEQAIAELEVAIRNLVNAQTLTNPVHEAFDECFTGRRVSAARIQAEIQRATERRMDGST